MQCLDVFQVGFFPSQCVEVIGDKTDGQASLPRHTASSHMTPGLFTLLWSFSDYWRHSWSVVSKRRNDVFVKC